MTGPWHAIRNVFRSGQATVPLVTALVTAVVTAVLTLGTQTWLKYEPKDQLAIVDITFVKSAGGPEVIDIKVRNTGTKVAFLKRVQLEVQKQWALQPTLVPKSAISPSAEYEVVLPGNGHPPYSLSAPISHSVEPNAVDAFRLNINAFAQNDFAHLLFLTSVTLHYNETDRTVTSGPMLLAMGPRPVERLREMYIHIANSPSELPPGATVFMETETANAPKVRELADVNVPRSPFAAAVLDAAARQVGPAVK